MPKISIAIPFHWMQNWEFFMTRCLQSIEKQTFTNYEIVMLKKSTMPLTSNAVMDQCSGELIKILYLDDYFAHSNALDTIVTNFEEKDTWLVTGCLHDYGYGDKTNPHYPEYTENISTGNNRIGSPSVLTIRNEGHLKFDENLSWLLDCDLYKRYNDTFGAPKILNDLNVVIGVGSHQTTNVLGDNLKRAEVTYLKQKYG